MNTRTKRQHLIFDLDDTLIHCNKYFDLILEQFAELLVDWFKGNPVTAAEIRDKQTEIDVAGVHQIGFSSSHFPESLVETYRYFCRIYGRKALPEEEQRLMKLGLSVYEHPVEPYPGMVETLNLLRSQGHELLLYTGGETAIQQRKIEQMKLAEFFEDRIYIRQHKNAEALEEILRSRFFDRTSTWMIGNSLRTDVMPALSAGINAVYIKIPNEWLYNIVELQQESNSNMHTVSSLEEVPRIIFDHIHQMKRQKRTL
ncbi:HAD hydrolase-like protein [Paenibacillus macerans]|uniref:HAD hydrolase-like protein n=1 Tax=Paenibacillus macerans TaxID=44252 RepID=A0A090ZDR3_PAEMA|nr:HAD family hydrolase [Paenibacillus macerans]KFN08782.1 haloacid dehalogenase-like hydrolase family protein [Paenibacillus macerans]MBS5912216.1 HAD family hydrolase [Paenibacillus macerans]MCY7562126.1 HAD hydrolase-like protein [Paenibacillus macerans]MEC0140113.1 HAD hydrolase-like protein [Paenibacillus macerans]MEC0155135.1 HAD hydrolase-like protein [Paenibacillus macerans]